MHEAEKDYITTLADLCLHTADGLRIHKTADQVIHVCFEIFYH